MKTRISLVLAAFLAVFVSFGLGAKPVVLNWLRVNQPWMAIEDKHMNDYMAKNPNIKIEVIASPFAQYLQKVQMTLSTGGADLFEVDPTQISQLVYYKLILAADNLMKNKDDFLPIALQMGSCKGKIYSWPIMESSQVLYYNADMMATIGAKPPQKPENRWTWNEVKDVALKITKDLNGDGNNDVWGIDVQQANRPYQLWPLMESKGVDPVSKDFLSVDGFLNNPKAVEAFQFYGDLYNKWKVASKSPIQEAFETGKVGMFLAGPWAYPNFEKYPDLKWDSTWHPYFDTPVTPCSGWHQAIAAKGRNRQAAADFLNDKTGTANAIFFYQNTKLLPAKKSVINELGSSFTNDAVMNKCWYELSKTAVIRPRTPAYSEYEDAFLRALQDIIMGADAKTRLDEAVVEIDRAMSKYKK